MEIFDLLRRHFMGGGVQRPPQPTYNPNPIEVMGPEAMSRRVGMESSFGRLLPRMPQADTLGLEQKMEKERLFARALEAYMRSRQSGLQAPPFEEVWRQIQNAVALQKVQERLESLGALSDRLPSPVR